MENVNSGIFAKTSIKGSRENPPAAFNSILGETTDIDDTQEEDMQKIQPFVPNPGDTSVDEGFAKMMSILGKAAPTMQDSNANTNVGNIIPEKDVDIFSQKKQVTKEEEIIEQQPVKKKKETKTKEKKTNKKVTNMNTEVDPIIEDDKQEKPQTRSEILGLHYTNEEILPLLDSLLIKGYASETTMIRGNKISFRTTFSWEDQEVVIRTDRKVFEENIKLTSTGSYFSDLYALAANLLEFGANYFEPIAAEGTYAEKMKSFEDRITFLSNTSSPMITILATKRLEFMKKVQYLIDNYEELLKAF